MWIENAQSTLVTTDAVAHTILSIPTPTNTGGNLLVRVYGKNAATGKVANFVQLLAVQNVAGTAALLGVVTTLLTILNGSDASMTTTAVTIAFSGANVLVQVTGIAATTINWQANVSEQGLV